MSEVTVRAAVKRFGPTTALAGVDLTVPTGSLTAVLGPSGCGKTTLLRCVAGFERLDDGEVRIDGHAVASSSVHVPPQRRRVAVVPQEGALFPHLSVAGNVGYGLDRAARRSRRVDEVLELVGLAGLGARMPHQLSGGQQQRVAVARALAPRPSLVLLDEPFSALDAGLRNDLRQDVRAALRADGATAILVTHDQGEALSTADQIAVMRAGQVIQSGSPADVYRVPADPWVATFVGEAVLLPATVDGAAAHTPLGRIPLGRVPAADRAAQALPARTGAGTSDAGSGAGSGTSGAGTVLLRPEQIRITTQPTATGVPATVTGHDFHGHDALITLRLADGTRVTARVLGTDEPVRVDTAVTLAVDGQGLAYPA